LKNNYNIDPEFFNGKSVLLSCHIGVDEEVFKIIPEAFKYIVNSCIREEISEDNH
jgi:hypothetical protein